VRVNEAIKKGLESIGVQAVFGGAGKNAAHLLLALKARPQNPRNRCPTHTSGLIHGIRLPDVHPQAGCLLRDCGTVALNLFCGLAGPMSDFYPCRPS
jgi:acetolactate synthase I/II/III large subunit